jgi:hypothetical protein
VEAARSGIVENVPAVKEYYRNNFGMELNDNQIFASIIDPAVGEAIIEGRITQAQIGGEAAARGFALSPEEAQALERAGLTQSRRFQPEDVSVTEEVTPEGLVDRPGFAVEEFVQAQVFGSAEERERIKKLEAQEESEFTPTTGAVRRGRRVLGLVEE